MRYIYTIGFCAALPFILLRLFWRSLHNSDHKKSVGERLGFYSNAQRSASIWCHAVSYGEAVAAEPLLKKIRAQFPTTAIVVTTMTLTGATRVKTIWQDEIQHHYVPYDIPFAVKRFFKHTRPVLGIIMETELWPNLLHIASKLEIPLLLANARLSSRSYLGYRRVARLITPLIRKITKIAAQTEEDADRFKALGISPNRVMIAGNLKFDAELPASQIGAGVTLRKQLPHNYVITAASTHPDEEELLLQVFSRLQTKFPKGLLILAPRHPERFDEVAALCEKHGKKPVRRSLQEVPAANTAVFLGDTMGELPFYYAMAQIAFVGGSLVPAGGHNLLEPAALKLPIVAGSHLSNFQSISALLTSVGALSVVHNVNELYMIFCKLLEDKQLGDCFGLKGYEVIEKNRGASMKHLQVIDQLLRGRLEGPFSKVPYVETS